MKSQTELLPHDMFYCHIKAGAALCPSFLPAPAPSCCFLETEGKTVLLSVLGSVPGAQSKRI